MHETTDAPFPSGAEMRDKLEQLLDRLEQANFDAYCQLLMQPFATIPCYAAEDPGHGWWSSEECAEMERMLLAAVEDALA
jgi:hypothetical protein